MEHISLLATTIGSEDIMIGSARLGKNIIANANQDISSVDIRVRGGQYLPFGSQKIGNEMSVDFRGNADEKIGMNPSRTIGSPRPHITSTSLKLGNQAVGSCLQGLGVAWHNEK